MRQNQHSGGKRMRGRNRKGPNPMSRNYESNGPDVKIRGNASHIAEKYSTLARDALVSGDRVMAENYLQHAEHYNRIISAAQAQIQAQAEQQQNQQQSQPDVGESNGRDRRGPPSFGDDPASAEAANAATASDETPAEGAVDSEDKPRAVRSRRGRRGPRAKAENGADLSSESESEAPAAEAAPDQAPSESAEPVKTEEPVAASEAAEPTISG